MKDLFLCHNGADKDWTRTLGERIEQEQWAGRTLSVFFDEWDIQPGENILLRINEGLDGSRYVALVLSPEMLRADWPTLEWTSVLSDDPLNRRGRLIPLLLRDADRATSRRVPLPAVLRPLSYVDFRDPKDFSRGYARLLARIRGEPPPRGGSPPRPRGLPSDSPVLATFATERQEPDAVQETIISNLLPVLDIPKVVWSRETSLKNKTDLPTGNDLPPFILRADRLYTFANISLSGTPFAPWLSGEGPKRDGLPDLRKDPDRWRWIIELLNLSLKQHLFDQNIAFDRETKRYYFRPRKPGKSVQLRWGTGTKRTVVRAPEAGAGGHWVHQGARFSFETLGDRLFLAIEPCWIFTTDGKNSIRKQDIGPMAMQWGGKERNGAIVRHVLMWADVLACGQRTAQIESGDRRIVIGRLPATVGMGVGIADDHVAIGALLKFTKAEQELQAPDEVVFEFIDEEGDDHDDVEDQDAT